MRFNKEDMDMWINCYGSLKEDGLSLKEIQDYFKVNFGLKDISSIRKNYDLLNRVNRIEVNQSNIEQIAEAKADLLVNRKINIQMNKDLHKVANDEARWEIIQEYLYNKIPFDPVKDLDFRKQFPISDKDVIYIVGDVHYRGKEDNDLIIKTFSKIKDEIKSKHYKNVTLILTGDNVDGEIHNEQQRTNEPVLDATMELTNLYIQCINSIKEISKIYMVFGNHEEVRLWGDKNTQNNVGKFIFWGLNNMCGADVYAADELLFEYKNKTILLMHGHQGYAKSKAKLIEHCATSYKEIPDYIILGHFHTSKMNQFSKNHWLITAPALKNWESNWDLANGYCGLGQYLKLKLNLDTPQITTLNVDENN